MDVEHAAILREVQRPPSAGTGQRALLRCWTEAVSGTIVLRTKGEVDVTTTPMLADAIAASYRTGSRVVVDLGGLAYLDASGIRVLEDAARAHPEQFVVVASKREIHRLFEVLDLVNTLPVVRSLEAAREYFGLG